MRRKHNTSDIPNIALISIRHHIELCEEVVTVTVAWINSGLFTDQQTRNYKQKSNPFFCLIEEKIKEEKNNYQRRALHCLFRIRLSVFISFHAWSLSGRKEACRDDWTYKDLMREALYHHCKLLVEIQLLWILVGRMGAMSHIEEKLTRRFVLTAICIQVNYLFVA